MILSISGLTCQGTRKKSLLKNKLPTFLPKDLNTHSFHLNYKDFRKEKNQEALCRLNHYILTLPNRALKCLLFSYIPIPDILDFCIITFCFLESTWNGEKECEGERERILSQDLFRGSSNHVIYGDTCRYSSPYSHPLSISFLLLLKNFALFSSFMHSFLTLSCSLVTGWAPIL